MRSSRFLHWRCVPETGTHGEAGRTAKRFISVSPSAAGHLDFNRSLVDREKGVERLFAEVAWVVESLVLIHCRNGGHVLFSQFKVKQA